jgi:chromosome segregation ATPase
MTGAVWTLIGLLAATLLGLGGLLLSRIDAINGRLDKLSDDIKTNESSLTAIDERTKTIEKRTDEIDSGLRTAQLDISQLLTLRGKIDGIGNGT